MHRERIVIPGPELASSVFSLNMQSLPVGDDILAEHLSSILDSLANARGGPNQNEAFGTYNETHGLVRPVLHRIGELLHTNAMVDLNI